MQMKFSKLYRVKESKLSLLKEWFEILSGERKDEAIATFQYENVSREIFVLFQGHEGDYYIVGLNEVNGEYKKGDPDVKINEEHTQILKECLEPISDRGDVLLDLGK